MNFLISDTFTDSLSKLAGEEQKAVKTTTFDLQVNSANPGLRFHKLDKIKEQNFWSVSASMDLRIIVHRTDATLLLCYVDHHDNAYDWAGRRRLIKHPKTGAAQLVELVEKVKEIPVYVDTPTHKPKIFDGYTDDQLLSYGVPEQWLGEVRKANEDSILELADHLPSEAAEALLDLATGVTPDMPEPAKATVDPFEHPDAQRRFRVMGNAEELERALDYPWEKWTIFLHPKQRQFAEQSYSGPARVSGSAGTGKTIVALHRAVKLARDNEDARILLTTFSDALANALHTKLKRLISSEPRLAERLEVCSMHEIGKRLYERNVGKVDLIEKRDIEPLLISAAKDLGATKFTNNFLLSEWNDVVDSWQLKSWEAYRDVRRLGRKTRLNEAKRELLWSIFSRVIDHIEQQGKVTAAGMFDKLASVVAENKRPPFEFVVIDEAQDISVSQLRFVAAIGTSNPESLFFAGDLGQRIFQQPFSWKALGVNIQGRSRILKINYRTSHQIRTEADKLLTSEISDADGNLEDRRGTISVFNSEKPEIYVADDEDAEIQRVADWIQKHLDAGLEPSEIGIFVRSENELERAEAAAKEVGCAYKVMDEQFDSVHGSLVISTMHLAKGLEFRAVVVMACDEEVIPSEARIEAVSDETDLQEVYSTERHLLYVACTRARDYLMISGVEPGSEFIEDLLG